MDQVEAHVERETLEVEVNLPQHEVRKDSLLFHQTRLQLIQRDRGCWICGSTQQLEAHHHPVEWSMANMVDWGKDSEIRQAFPNYDWNSVKSPYDFVDNMLVNGMLLCKKHHTGKNEGIHNMPFPLWVAQRWGKVGYKFSSTEILAQEETSK